MKQNTQAQQRILDLLSDRKLHALLIELESMGYVNQHPAIKALEKKGLIKVVIDGGYYSRWQLIKELEENEALLRR